MRRRSTSATLIVVQTLLCVSPLRAQPDLPPPPPPPLEPPPALPPPPNPTSSSAPRPSLPPPATSGANGPPPRRGSQGSSPPPPYRLARRHVPDVPYAGEETARPVVGLTLNPLDLVLGRLSANVEVQVASHHSLVASPNILLIHVDRGGRYSLASEGLGFATTSSSGFGIELGYHYDVNGQRSMRGPFFGPSILFGGTSDASVGDPSHTQAYWGLAFDAGAQEVFSGGVTIGAGVGLGVILMTDAVAVFPRLLLQVGWSF